MFGRLGAAVTAMDLGHSPLLDGTGPEVRTARTLWAEFGMTILAILAGLIAGGLIVIVLFVVIFIAAAIAMSGDMAALNAMVLSLQGGEPPKTFEAALSIVVMLAVINGIFVLVLVWIASLLQKQPLKASFTSAPKFRWRHLVLGLFLYGAALAGLQAVEVALGAISPEWPVLTYAKTAPMIALFVVVTVIGLIVAAGAEELLFRGWLLRSTSAFTRNIWILLLINGPLFSLIHLDPDINAFIARSVMGIAFCYMALRFGGIEFATGAHAANNIVIILFIEPLTIKAPPPQPFNATFLVESAVLLAIGIGVTELALRIPALRRWARP